MFAVRIATIQIARIDMGAFFFITIIKFTPLYQERTYFVTPENQKNQKLGRSLAFVSRLII